MSQAMGAQVRLGWRLSEEKSILPRNQLLQLPPRLCDGPRRVGLQFCTRSDFWEPRATSSRIPFGTKWGSTYQRSVKPTKCSMGKNLREQRGKLQRRSSVATP